MNNNKKVYVGRTAKRHNARNEQDQDASVKVCSADSDVFFKTHPYEKLYQNVLTNWSLKFSFNGTYIVSVSGKSI